METTMNNLHPDTAAPVNEAPQPNAAARPVRRAGRPGDDVVRWAEFRLALWIGGFALAVIISGQGLLFSAILDLKDDIGGLRTEMHTQVGGLRAEMQAQIGGLRAEMQAQIGGLRAEMHTQVGGLRAEMQAQIGGLRAEMQAQIGDLRAEMQAQIGDLRKEMQTQFGELRERIVRIEAHLGIDAGSVEKAN